MHSEACDLGLTLDEIRHKINFIKMHPRGLKANCKARLGCSAAGTEMRFVDQDECAYYLIVQHCEYIISTGRKPRWPSTRILIRACSPSRATRLPTPQR